MRPTLERLEDRLCPTTYSLPGGQSGNGSIGPFHQGDQLHMVITVTSTDPNEAADNHGLAFESSLATSSFHAYVPVGQTQTVDYTAQQNGEYILIAVPSEANGIPDEGGTISVSINATPQPTVTLGPLQLADVAGSGFLNGSGSSSNIALGLKPASGSTFLPLINVCGSITYNTGDIHGSGIVTTSVSGTTIPLFTGSFDIHADAYGNFPTSFNLPPGTNSTLALGGATVSLESVTLANGAIQLQGKASLPAALGGAQLAMDGANYLTISQSGIALSGATITGPGGNDISFRLAGLRMTAHQLSADYDLTNNDLKLHGTLTLPDLYGTSADLTGANFIDIQNGTVSASADLGVHNFAIPDSLGIPGGWSVTNATLHIDTSTPSVGGSCTLVGPGGISMLADLSPAGATLGITADPNTQFSLGGLTVTVSSLYFDTNGQLQVYGSVTLPDGLGTVSLAPGGIGITGGRVNFSSWDVNLLNLVEVKARNTSIAYDAVNQRWLLQGTATLPGVFGLTANFSGTDSHGNLNGIIIQGSSVSVSGTIALGSLTIPGTGYGLTNAFFSFDPTFDIFDGGADLQIPGLPTLQAIFGIYNDQLSAINVGAGDVNNGSASGFQLGQGDLNIPLGASGAVLQGISGALDTSTLTFTGKVDITYGPDFKVAGFGTVPLLDLVLSGTIDPSGLHASGNASILGGSVATGSADVTLAWAPSFDLSADANFDFFNGTVVVAGTLDVNSHGFSLTGTASLNTPEVDIWGIHIPSQQVANINAALSYVAGAPLSQDFVSAAAGFSLPWPIGTATLGLKVTFDGGIHPIANWHDPASSTVTIPAGTPWFLLSAAWQNATAQAVPVTVKAPDGTIYSAANFDNTHVGLVSSLSSSTSLVVGLQNPMPGRWTIQLPDTTGLGTVTFHGVAQAPPPAVQITKIDTSGTQAIIHYQVQHSDPDARIRLLYSTSSTDQGGLLIKSGLFAPNGNGSYTWNTAGVPAGQYYISALIDDGHSPLALAQFATPIAVANQPPKLNHIADQTVVAGSRLSLTTVAGDPNNDRLTFSLGAGAPPFAAIDSYTGAFTWQPDPNQATQDFLVPIVVTDNGGLSATQTFKVHVIQPAFTSAAAAAFTVGSFGNWLVTASAPRPVLSESATDTLPHGVTFDPRTGRLHGKPAAGTAGTYTLHFTADYPGGREITQTFTLTVVQPALFTSAARTIFTAGTPGSFTVSAVGYPTPPTLRERSSDKLPLGVTFDAATGTLTSTAATPAGTYLLHFIAHTGIGPDATQTFTLIAGRPPSFTGTAAAAFTVGKAGSYKLTATGSPTPVLSEDPGDVLPAGIKFNALTGVLSGTPATGTAGTYTLHFTAHNGAGSDFTETFILTVANRAGG